MARGSQEEKGSWADLAAAATSNASDTKAPTRLCSSR